MGKVVKEVLACLKVAWILGGHICVDNQVG